MLTPHFGISEAELARLVEPLHQANNVKDTQEKAQDWQLLSRE
jgi:hypothetical protein